MKKYLLSLVVLVFMLFSLSSVSYAEVVESTDGSAYVVTGQNNTLSDQTLTKDLYIPKGCSLTTTGNVTINGSIYVFGTLRNTGVLNINQTLYCLHYGSMLSAGNYDYGYVTSTGRITPKNMEVKDSFLNTKIPSISSAPSTEPDTPVTEPDTPSTDPDTPSTDPDTPVTEPDTPAGSDTHVHRWQREWSYKTYCSDTGIISYYCLDCGVTKEELTGPESHIMSNWAITQPTCVKEGRKSRACTICQYQENITIPATGSHVMGAWDVTNPTCVDDGYKTRTCTVCGYSEYLAIPSIGVHTYGKWRITKVATRYVTGKGVSSCTICGHKVYQTIAKLKTKSSKDEINVKKATDSFFKTLKKYDTKKLQKCFATPKKVKLFTQKKYVAKYIRKHNKSLWYQIQDIKVSKKTATVTVSCNYFDAYSQIFDSLDDCVQYMVKKKHVSNSALDKYQYNRLLHYDKNECDYVDTKVTLKFKKVGKNWKLQNPSNQLYNVMHCNYTNAYNDYF